jgi:hypothetical protein
MRLACRYRNVQKYYKQTLKFTVTISSCVRLHYQYLSSFTNCKLNVFYEECEGPFGLHMYGISYLFQSLGGP